MKRLLCLIVLLGAVSGCAKPVVIDNGTQSRVFIPCTNDNLCFKDTYNVAWDNPTTPLYISTLLFFLVTRMLEMHLCYNTPLLH